MTAGLGWAGLGWAGWAGVGTVTAPPPVTLSIYICSHIWVYLFFQVCSCVAGAGRGSYGECCGRWGQSSDCLLEPGSWRDNICPARPGRRLSWGEGSCGALGAAWSVELQTKVRKDVTITEKAPTSPG